MDSQNIRVKIRTAPDAPLKVLHRTPLNYNELISLIKEKYSAVKLMDSQHLQLTYTDDFGNAIEISDDDDLASAF